MPCGGVAWPPAWVRAATFWGCAQLLQRAAAIEARFAPLGLAARDWLRMVRPWLPRAGQGVS